MLKNIRLHKWVYEMHKRGYEIGKMTASEARR